MQTMRYINLLDRASHVRTHKCFLYNNNIIFAVPKHVLSRAIGPDAMHVRALHEQLGKRVRIIAEPESIQNAERFISDIVAPVKFKSLELKDNVFVLAAGSQSKAALIGRNRRREAELQKILYGAFGFDLKIV